MTTHLKHIQKIVLLSLAVFIFCAPAGVLAADKKDVSKQAENPQTSDISQAVTQSYNADPSVQVGMLVKLKDKTTVTPLGSQEVDKLLGVVVPKDNATITLTPQTVTTQQVLVASTGSFSVLVSNQNGPIKLGDYLTISALSGVAMKADENQRQIIGKATSDFTGSSNVIGTVKIKDSLGKTNNVSIGRSTLSLKVNSNPLYQRSADFVPGFAAKAADSVANKPVSVARIYLGMVILVATAIITSTVMFSGIRNGMIAVGRNPLSKKSIIRSLIQTVFAGLIIFVTGIFAVYLLLKL